MLMLMFCCPSPAVASTLTPQAGQVPGPRLAGPHGGRLSPGRAAAVRHLGVSAPAQALAGLRAGWARGGPPGALRAQLSSARPRPAGSKLQRAAACCCGALMREVLVPGTSKLSRPAAGARCSLCCTPLCRLALLTPARLPLHPRSWSATMPPIEVGFAQMEMRVLLVGCWLPLFGSAAGSGGWRLACCGWPAGRRGGFAQMQVRVFIQCELRLGWPPGEAFLD